MSVWREWEKGPMGAVPRVRRNLLQANQGFIKSANIEMEKTTVANRADTATLPLLAITLGTNLGIISGQDVARVRLR